MYQRLVISDSVQVGSARMAVQSSQHELAAVTNDKLRLSQQLRARRNPGIELVVLSINN